MVTVHIFLYRFLLPVAVLKKKANYGKSGLYDVKRKKQGWGMIRAVHQKKTGKLYPIRYWHMHKIIY